MGGFSILMTASTIALGETPLPLTIYVTCGSILLVIDIKTPFPFDETCKSNSFVVSTLQASPNIVFLADEIARLPSI